MRLCHFVSAYRFMGIILLKKPYDLHGSEESQNQMFRVRWMPGWIWVRMHVLSNVFVQTVILKRGGKLVVSVKNIS